MERVQWKLREYLQGRHISTLHLESEAKSVSRVTLYRLTSPDPNKQPQRVDLPTLAAVVKGLRLITGEEVSVCDLLEFQDDEANEANATT